MDVPKDFLDLCSLLNEKRVEYLLIGGYAVGFHGAPRFTGDLDLFVGPDVENVRHMLEALSIFGFASPDVTPECVIEKHQILQIGRIPRQVHLMTSIGGVSWDEAWNSRQAGQYVHVTVNYISFEALLANKRSTGRLKDAADVQALTRNRPAGRT